MKRTTDHNSKRNAVIALMKLSGILLSSILLAATIYLYVKQNDRQVSTVKVLVAKQTLNAQQPVTAENLGIMEFVMGYEPPTAYTEADAKTIIGKKPVIAVQKGDVMLPSFFGAADTKSSIGIANLIPDGYKVVYIPRENAFSFPPELQKQSVVDVLVLNQKTDQRNAADVLLERVTVFDVIRTGEDTVDSIAYIALLLKNEEVLPLSNALTDSWKLQFVFRPTIETASSSATLQDLDESSEASSAARTDENE
jgi:Flp pilus assembly protein CpaB